jgi:hypothetical protein
LGVSRQAKLVLMGDMEFGGRPALEDEHTGRALHAYRSRSAAFFLGGGAMIVIGFLVLGVPENGPNAVEVVVGALGVSWGVVIAVMGGHRLVRSFRFSRVLRGHPWVAHPVRTGWNGSGQVIRLDDEPPDRQLYRLSINRYAIDEFVRRAQPTLLVAGTPARCVVVAPPDRTSLVAAARPRQPRRFRKVFWRPAPRQPGN